MAPTGRAVAGVRRCAGTAGHPRAAARPSAPRAAGRESEDSGESWRPGQVARFVPGQSRAVEGSRRSGHRGSYQALDAIGPTIQRRDARIAWTKFEVDGEGVLGAQVAQAVGPLDQHDVLSCAVPIEFNDVIG